MCNRILLRIILIAGFFSIQFLFSCSNLETTSDTSDIILDDEWPPILLTADENNVAFIDSEDLLEVPEGVQKIIDSVNIELQIAQKAPLIELIYHDGLPHSAKANGTGWSSWGDICLASDGMVYSGTGNHWGIDHGEAYVYQWNPSERKLKKIADINKLTGAKDNDVRFSKVHAHIFEGKDRRIYFTGTLDDGGKAEREPILSRWNENIGSGIIFQYDPLKDTTTIYATLPEKRVTATITYNRSLNLLYCALEGHPAYNDGVSLGVFDMGNKRWVYEGPPGQIAGTDRNFIMDKNGNLYFNGYESYSHTGVRLNNLLTSWKNEKPTEENLQRLISSQALPKPTSTRGIKIDRVYSTLWKYDPVKNSVNPTDSYFTNKGLRCGTRESSEGLIYGISMGYDLFEYEPANDKLNILGPDFLADGQYITVCVLSPDEKFLYYLPGAHGGAITTGTPVIQYDILKKKQKALAFLYHPMMKKFNYAPGGTYGMKISDDGSTLFIGLNGSHVENAELNKRITGFGLTSLAIVHIPEEER